jgi:hypothetical protein
MYSYASELLYLIVAEPAGEGNEVRATALDNWSWRVIGRCENLKNGRM